MYKWKNNISLINIIFLRVWLNKNPRKVKKKESSSSGSFNYRLIAKVISHFIILIKIRRLIQHKPYKLFTTLEYSCQWFPVGLIMKLAGSLMVFRENKTEQSHNDVSLFRDGKSREITRKNYCLTHSPMFIKHWNKCS